MAFQQHGIPRQFRLKQAYSVFLSFEKKTSRPPNKKVTLPPSYKHKSESSRFLPPKRIQYLPDKNVKVKK